MTTQKSETFVKMKNPYTFGVPVRGENFFGREEELGIIFDTLENVPRGQKQDLVVLGPRRIGKSSLLYRLVDLLTPHPEFVPVYVDLQNIKPRKTRLLFFKTLRQIKRGYKQKTSQVALPDFETLTSPYIAPDFEFTAFDDDFQALNDVIASDNFPRLVLIFDEVDLLEEFGGHDTLGWFRSIIQSMQYTIFVVAGTERLYSMTQDYGSPFYNIFKTVELHPLTDQAAQNLLQIPAAKIGMQIDQEGIYQILESCGKNPYLVQGIAHYLVERLNSEKRRQVYSHDVAYVIDRGVKYLSAQFTYIWGVTSQVQKILLFALAKKGRSQSPDTLVSSVPALANLIQSKKEQQEVFDDLVRQQILSEVNHRYWFIVPLFVDWILSELDEQEISPTTMSKQPETSQRLSLPEIRRLLTQKFNDSQFDGFLLDYFPYVYDQLSRGMRKNEKITLLLDHVRRRGSVDYLLSLIEREGGSL